MNEQIPPLDAPPIKVCAKCSVQTETSGEFCPHCGSSYIARRRRPGRKAVAAITTAVLLLAGTAVGITLKVNHDQDQEREAALAQRRESEQTAADQAREEEEAEAAAKQARQQAKAVAAQAERNLRTRLVKQMQGSITKDAKERVSAGELDGPIFYTSCDPLGGGSVDDLTALTSTFECLAVNEKLDDGTVRGWVFSSTANWDKSTWSWRLGR